MMPLIEGSAKTFRAKLAELIDQYRFCPANPPSDPLKDYEVIGILHLEMLRVSLEFQEEEDQDEWEDNLIKNSSRRTHKKKKV